MMIPPEYELVIHNAAVSAARRYPAPVSDLKQEVYCAYLSADFQKRLKEVIDSAEDGERGFKDSIKYVQGMAYRAAGRAGLVEKAQLEGFDPDDIARYSAGAVEALLAQFFQWKRDGSMPSAQERHGMPSSNVPENERGVAQAMMCDLSRAFDRLPREDQYVLAAEERDPVDPWGKLAAQLGIEEKSARQRYRRIVDRMCRFLNDFRTIAEMEYQGLGSRTVVSNELAQRRAS